MREDAASSTGTQGLQRYRRAAFSGAAALFSAAMPLVLHYLGAERFGLWITLTSLVTLAGLRADLGIGSGLINTLSTAHGTNDRTVAQIYVSSVFFMSLLLSTILLVVLLTVDASVRWPSVFHLSSPISIAEVVPAVTVLSSESCSVCPRGPGPDPVRLSGACGRRSASSLALGRWSPWSGAGPVCHGWWLPRSAATSSL